MFRSEAVSFKFSNAAQNVAASKKMSWTCHSDVKSLLQSKCGLSNLVLDNLLSEGATKRVTVGVSDEADGAILWRKINGLYMDNQHQLNVEVFSKERETEQPLRTSTLLDHEPMNLNQMEQQTQLAMDQSMVFQAQYMMQNTMSMTGYMPQIQETGQPLRTSTLLDHQQMNPNQMKRQKQPAMDQSMVPQAQYMMQNTMSMTGYYMPQIQDPNYDVYKNQAYIPGMQTMSKAPVMQEHVNTNIKSQNWGHQQQSVSWEGDSENHLQDRRRNDRSRSTSPLRTRFQPRLHEPNSRRDNRDSNRVAEANPPRKPCSQDQYTSAHNDDNPPMFRQAMSRPERLYHTELYGNDNNRDSGQDYPPDSRFNREQKPPRFEETRNRNQFTNVQQIRRHDTLRNTTFKSARFSDSKKDRSCEPPVKKSVPTHPSNFDKRALKVLPSLSLEKKIRPDDKWRGQAAAEICKNLVRIVQKKKPFVPDSHQLEALKQAIRARIDVILGNTMGVHNVEMVLVKYRDKYWPRTDIKLFNLVMAKFKKVKGAAIDKNLGKEQKKLEKKFAIEIDNKLEPLQAALDSEMNAIEDILRAESIDSRDNSDIKVCKPINDEAAEEIKKLRAESIDPQDNSDMKVCKPINDEAAEEIKKLRAESVDPRDNCNINVCKPINDKAAEEIKKLRAESIDPQDNSDIKVCKPINDKAAEEIKKLRAESIDLQDNSDIKVCKPINDKAAEEIKKLRAESIDPQDNSDIKVCKPINDKAAEEIKKETSLFDVVPSGAQVDQSASPPEYREPNRAQPSRGRTTARSRTLAAVARDLSTCLQCGHTGHNLLQCQDWQKQPVLDRRRLVKLEGLCFSCAGDHFERDCPTPQLCSACDRPHHLLLCRYTSGAASPTPQQGQHGCTVSVKPIQIQIKTPDKDGVQVTEDYENLSDIDDNAEELDKSAHDQNCETGDTGKQDYINLDEFDLSNIDADDLEDY